MAMTIQQLRRVHPGWLAYRQDWLDVATAINRRIDKSAYLPRAKFERDAEYQARIAMSEWVPESPQALSRIIGAIFSTSPDRKGVPKHLMDWMQDVDVEERTFDHWLEIVAAPIMLGYGAVHVLIDREAPDADDAPILSLADQQAQGKLAPNVCAYTPLEVRNWEIGSDGHPIFVLIVEDASRALEPMGEVKPRRRYRAFFRDRFEVYETEPDGAPDFLPDHWKPNGEPVVDDKTRNLHEKILTDPMLTFTRPLPVDGLGVPIVTIAHDPITPMIGRSVIREAVLLDFKRFQLESDQDWDLYVHAHPTLVVTTARELADIAVGANTYIKLDPDPQKPETAQYLSLPSESFTARAERVQEVKAALHAATGADPLATPNRGMGGGGGGGGRGASGVARAWSYLTTEGRHLARIAARIEDGEQRILESVAKFLGVKELPAHAVSWPEEFALQSGLDMIEECLQFRQAVRSDAAVRTLEKKTARTILGDLDPTLQSAIDAEIDQQPPRADAGAPFGAFAGAGGNG